MRPTRERITSRVDAGEHTTDRANASCHGTSADIWVPSCASRRDSKKGGSKRKAAGLRMSGVQISREPEPLRGGRRG
jgi:hypothetical protein